MGERIRTSVWVYRLAIAWAVFFLVGSVCTSILGSLQNVDWYELNGQSRFLTIVAIVGNVANTMMAFISKAATKVESGKPLVDGGTDFFKKQEPTKPNP